MAGRSSFLHAQKVDPLAAGDLDHRHVVFVGRIGNRAQFGGVGHTAPHARHDGIGAVLLDVGVVAFVDEPRLAVIDVFGGPVGDQVVVQRWAAGRAAAHGFPAQFLHHRRDGFQAHGFDQPPHVFMRVIGAFAHRRIGIGGKAVAKGQRHDLFDQAGAGAAAGAGLGRRAHRVERGGTALNGGDDLALADAVAATDLRLRRQGCNGCQRVRAGPSGEGGAKDQRVAQV